MKATHEHEFEAALGLPEKLPKDEFIIWQGQPDWKQLAVDAFHVRKLAVYFSLMIMLQCLHLMDSDTAAMDMLMSLCTSLSLACLALGLLAGSAYFSSRATVYTLTNRRMVMRIGIVLSLTFNLPLKKIVSCELMALKHQVGNIALGTSSESPIGWLNLWPHVRAWRLNSPQPSLRCVPKAQEVCEHIWQAWRKESPSEQLVSTQNQDTLSHPQHLEHA